MHRYSKGMRDTPPYRPLDSTGRRSVSTSYYEMMRGFEAGLREHILNRRRLKVGLHLGYPLDTLN